MLPGEVQCRDADQCSTKVFQFHLSLLLPNAELSARYNLIKGLGYQESSNGQARMRYDEVKPSQPAAAERLICLASPLFAKACTSIHRVASLGRFSCLANDVSLPICSSLSSSMIGHSRTYLSRQPQIYQSDCVEPATTAAVALYPTWMGNDLDDTSQAALLHCT